jgi:hypothetical protein
MLHASMKCRKFETACSSHCVMIDSNIMNPIV